MCPRRHASDGIEWYVTLCQFTAGNIFFQQSFVSVIAVGISHIRLMRSSNISWRARIEGPSDMAQFSTCVSSLDPARLKSSHRARLICTHPVVKYIEGKYLVSTGCPTTPWHPPNGSSGAYFTKAQQSAISKQHTQSVTILIIKFCILCVCCLLIADCWALVK